MSVLELTVEQYHRDEGTTEDGRPTLSRSAAVRLIEASPLHVFHEHPKLSPTPAAEETADHLDIGTAVHALILRGEMLVDVHPFPDWRTNAAKAAKAASRNAGRIPMLTHKWETVETAIATIRDRIAELELEPAPFVDGKAERVVVWEEPVSTGGTVTCRALIDWLRDDLAIIDDLKTTPTGLANPREWARRRLFDHGGDVQAAFYTRALEALGADPRPRFRFIVVETSPPFGVSVVVPDEAVLELGNRKVEWALRKWKACIDSGTWPGYGEHVATLPTWVENAWLDREIDEAGDDPRDWR